MTDNRYKDGRRSDNSMRLPFVTRDLYNAVKAAANKRGETITDWVIDAMERHLTRTASWPQGLPMVDEQEKAAE